MSGYADDYKDQQQREFIAKWVPEGEDGIIISHENHVYVLARLRAAQAELERYKTTLRAFQDLIVSSR